MRVPSNAKSGNSVALRGGFDWPDSLPDSLPDNLPDWVPDSLPDHIPDGWIPAWGNGNCHRDSDCSDVEGRHYCQTSAGRN